MNLSDRAQHYREHLELLCDNSKREYCVGCGMTLQFFDLILEEQRKELITQLPDELKTFVRMSIDNSWQFTEEQVIKAEVAWHKLMERKLVEERNQVLDEVKREVEKVYDIKQFSDLQPEFNRGHKRGLDDTLYIIDQLKLN